MSEPSRKTCALVDARDECCCIRCGKSLYSVITFSRHHRRMRSHAFKGLHLPSNVIDVCGSGSEGCHGYIHQHPEESYRKGWLIHSWDDHPENMPVNTYLHGWVLLDNQGSWTPYEPTNKENTQ